MTERTRGLGLGTIFGLKLAPLPLRHKLRLMEPVHPIIHLLRFSFVITTDKSHDLLPSLESIFSEPTRLAPLPLLKGATHHSLFHTS
jgi:hypothetical protein